MRKLLFLIIVGVGTILAAASVPVNALTFNLNFQFSNLPNEAAEPVGPRPWLTATFEDLVEPNQVRLTMDTDGLTGTEFVSGWYFNIQDGLIIDSVSPFFPIVQAADGRDADGILGHGFDIEFPFPTAESDRFGADETRVFTLGAAGLTASSFNFLNEPDQTDGLFYSAAHVQAISNPNFLNNDSGWIATNPIPEPGTILLLGAGLASLFGIRRFKLTKN